MRNKATLALLLITGCLFACVPASPGSDSGQPPTVIVSATANIPTLSLVPTVEPTLIASPTPGFLWPQIPITEQNAADVKELSSFGRGRALAITFAVDRKVVVVETPGILYVYRASDFALQGKIESVAGYHVSAGGNFLAVMDTAGKFSVWDLKTAGEIYQFSFEEPRESQAIAFSPDESLVAVGYYSLDNPVYFQGVGPEDKVIRVFSIPEGELEFQLDLGEFAPIPGEIRISPNNGFLVVNQVLQAMAVWNLETLEAVRVNNPGSLPRVAFSPDSSMFMTMWQANVLSAPEFIRIWESNTGERLAHYGIAQRVWDAMFSNDGMHFQVNWSQARRTDDGRALTDEQASNVRFPEIGLFSLPHSAVFARLFALGHLNPATVFYGADGIRVLHHNNERALLVAEAWWDGQLDFDRRTQLYVFPQEEVQRISAAYAGSRLLGVLPEHSLVAFCVEGETQIYKVDGEGKSLGVCDSQTVLVFSPDGAKIALSDNSRINVIATDSAEVLGTLVFHNTRITKMVFSADGARLASFASERNRAPEFIVWDVEETGAYFRITSLPVDGLYVGGVLGQIIFSPDGSHLIGQVGRDLRYWRIVDSTQLVPFETPDLAPWSGSMMSFSRGGDILAIGGGDKNLYLISWPDFEILQTIVAHKSGINSIFFSSGDEFILTASQDGTVKQWGIP